MRGFTRGDCRSWDSTFVRIHHHDSEWVNPNIFGENAPATLAISPASLRKLDWWIKSLKEEGIYIWLDLDVGRSYTSADGIMAFEEIAKGRKSVRPAGFAYLNESIQERMKSFATEYLSHVNEYTGLSYKNDPAIAFVLITNENELTTHFGSEFLPERNVPYHSQLFFEKAKSFADRNGLDPELTWRSWLHGPAKLFLNDLEHQFNKEIIGHLRSIGVKSLLATTNFWGEMSMAGLPSLTDGDIVDAHSYADPEFLELDPRFQPNLAHWIGAAAVSGKPVTVSEWNVSPFPAYSRSSLPLYIASVANLQGWSAVLQYAYSQSSLDDTRAPDNWEMNNDAALLATMPLAAMVYRRSYVRQSEAPVTFRPGARELFDETLSPKTSAAIRTTVEQNRMTVELPDVKELPWSRPVRKESPNAVEDVRSSRLVDDKVICADTREFCRSWGDGLFWIDTRRIQVAAGWLGSKTVNLSKVRVELSTPYATVAVMSVDDMELSKSRHVLVALGAQTVSTPAGGTKTLSEPVTGDLTIQADEGLRLYRVDPSGYQTPYPFERVGDRYHVKLKSESPAVWLVLR